MVTTNMHTQFCSPHMYAQTTQSEQAPLKLTAKHVNLCGFMPSFVTTKL